MTRPKPVGTGCPMAARAPRGLCWFVLTSARSPYGGNQIDISKRSPQQHQQHQRWWVVSIKKADLSGQHSRRPSCLVVLIVNSQLCEAMALSIPTQHPSLLFGWRMRRPLVRTNHRRTFLPRSVNVKSSHCSVPRSFSLCSGSRGRAPCPTCPHRRQKLFRHFSRKKWNVGG